MAEQRTLSLEYTLYDDWNSLPDDSVALIRSAQSATQRAYAPYSKFHVGAAVLLETGKIITGSNKENASFPAGLCAERSALAQVSDRFPGETIKTIALAVSSPQFPVDEPIAPCGICRQVLCETERVQNHPIHLIMTAPNGRAMVVESCSGLLPFHFYLQELKQ